MKDLRELIAEHEAKAKEWRYVAKNCSRTLKPMRIKAMANRKLHLETVRALRRLRRLERPTATVRSRTRPKLEVVA